MGIASYFSKVNKKREEMFLVATEEEIEQLNAYRFRMIVWIVLGLVFSWTGIGLVLLIVFVFYYMRRMQSIRAKIYRRYLEKKKKK